MNKFKKIIWPIIYLLLVIFVCGSGCMIFHSYYYRSIFVDGDSMYPTLKGGTPTVDGVSYFGIINPHQSAIDKIERYNIVTTYYPWDDKDYKISESNKYKPDSGFEVLPTAYYKIKRVVGMPGDILRIKDGEVYFLPKQSVMYQHLYGKTEEEISDYINNYSSYIDYQNDLTEAFGDPIKLPYERHFGKVMTIKDVDFIQLAQDKENPKLNEYYLLGDNWGNSTDCGTLRKPVYQDNLVGVLVAIEGTCKIRTGKSTNGNNNRTCEDRRYFKPIFF